MISVLGDLLPTSGAEWLLAILGFAQGFTIVPTTFLGFWLTSALVRMLHGDKHNLRLSLAISAIVSIAVLVFGHYVFATQATEIVLPNGGASVRRLWLGWLLLGLTFQIVVPQVERLVMELLRKK